MEKIQTEVMSMLQAGMTAGVRQSASAGVDTSFDRLLKEQNQGADSQAPKAAVSKQDSRAESKTEAKPAKESGPKDKAVGSEDDGDAQDEKLIPSELLLQFQETAGQLANALAETVTAEQSEEALEAVLQPEPVLMAGQEMEMPETKAPDIEMPLQAEIPVETTTELREAAEMPEMAIAVAEEKEQPVKAASDGAAQAKPEMAKATSERQEALEETSGQVQKMAVPVKTSTGENAADTKGQEEQQLLTAAPTQPHEYAVREPEQISSEPVRTSEPTLVNDVGHAIAQRLPASDGTLTIELEPASLGKLTIHVLYESGKATVSILATNPRTLELLNAKATELGAILEERTGQETVVYTERPESEQPFDERQGEGQQREQRQENREHKDQADQDSFLQQLRLGFV